MEGAGERSREQGRLGHLEDVGSRGADGKGGVEGGKHLMSALRRKEKEEGEEKDGHLMHEHARVCSSDGAGSIDCLHVDLT